MKIVFKRFNTVLFKLTASYVAIIIASVLVIGVSANYYFKYYFNQQVTRANAQILSDVQQFIRKDIQDKADSIYLTLINENYDRQFYREAFELESMDDYMNINRIKNYMLEYQILNADWLSSISTYFVKSDTLVSSRGLLYKPNLRPNQKPEYMSRIIDAKPGFAYVPTGPYASIYDDTKDNTMFLIRKFPTSEEKGPVVYILFEVREQALQRILMQSIGKEPEELAFIMDGSGNIISSTGNLEYPLAEQEKYVREILNRQDQEGSMEQTVAGVKSVVSYTSIPNYEWKLVSVTPKSLYYKASSRLTITMAIICILAIAIGLFISNMFTRSIYSPIRAMVDHIGKVVGKEPSLCNEYAMINHAIDKMSTKINTLEVTMEANRPLIKQNMMKRLLLGRLQGEDQLEEFQRITGTKFRAQWYTVILHRMDRDIIENLSVENGSFIIYHVIEEIERMAQGQYIACEWGEDTIAVIAGCRENDYGSLIRNIRYINDYMFSNFYMSTTAVIGTIAASPLDLLPSFNAAQTAMKYRIFMPKMSIVKSEDVLQREESTQVLNSKLEEAFHQSLRSGKSEDVRQTLHRILTELAEGNYSASYCNQELMSLLSMVSEYLKECNVKSSDVLDGDLMGIFSVMEDIYAYEDWVVQISKNLFQYLEKKSGMQNVQIINHVKHYIDENIAGDLSLNAISEKVFISPQYLSRIFKEETGVNFSDYITERKMEKAKELLMTTNLNVEDISERVGYNTPHYFIKKFKEKYGMTPKNYKINHGLK